MTETSGAFGRANKIEPHRRASAHSRGWGVVSVCLAAFFLPCLAAGNGFAAVSPAKVEAAFLRNFAHYVTWPVSAFPDERAPWRVCVLGTDPFGEVLEETLEGRVEQGRGFSITRAASAEELPLCHIVYLGYGSSENRRAALSELDGQPVLTVGSAPGFLREGGIIRFQVSNHVELGINLDQANVAALKIPTKMLEVAREIIENGAVRRRR